MPRLDRKQSFGTLLETVTQQRLSQVASDALVELAKQLWYEERYLVPVLPVSYTHLTLPTKA